MLPALREVTPESGHRPTRPACPLSATSRHQHDVAVAPRAEQADHGGASANLATGTIRPLCGRLSVRSTNWRLQGGRKPECPT
jgi:hypothetical protein